VTTKTLRAACGRYGDAHLEASITRAWSTWNQFFTFRAADDIVAGDPLGASLTLSGRCGTSGLQGRSISD
jgi:hypothetical protein